jgi:translation initiation factor 1
MSLKNQNRVVYTTGIGRVCPGCGKPVDACTCRKQAAQRPAGDGIVRIRRETKGRNGKGVTVITGVPLEDTALQALGKQLKTRCGTGGTVKDGQIEIQGDHRDLLFSELTKLGWTVKKAGG